MDKTCVGAQFPSISGHPTAMAIKWTSVFISTSVYMLPPLWASPSLSLPNRLHQSSLPTLVVQWATTTESMYRRHLYMTYCWAPLLATLCHPQCQTKKSSPLPRCLPSTAAALNVAFTPTPTESIYHRSPHLECFWLVLITSKPSPQHTFTPLSSSPPHCLP